MDWQQAINRNREALAAVVAGLIAMALQSEPLTLRRPLPDPSRLAALAPQDEGNGPRRAVFRPLHRAIGRILRPAEAALRRLIVIVAAALLQKAKAVSKVGEAQAAISLPDFSAFGRGQKLPAFSLIDPRKGFGMTGKFAGFDRILPRISVPGVSEPFQPERRDEEVDIAALLRRIARLEAALKSLPRQARRLNRLMARRAKAAPGPGRIGPIRPGHPLGHKRKPTEPVDGILSDCHWLAQASGFKPP